MANGQSQNGSEVYQIDEITYAKDESTLNKCHGILFVP